MKRGWLLLAVLVGLFLGLGVIPSLIMGPENAGEWAAGVVSYALVIGVILGAFVLLVWGAGKLLSKLSSARRGRSQ